MNTEKSEWLYVVVCDRDGLTGPAIAKFEAGIYFLRQYDHRAGNHCLTPLADGMEILREESLADVLETFDRAKSVQD